MSFSGNRYFNYLYVPAAKRELWRCLLCLIVSVTIGFFIPQLIAALFKNFNSNFYLHIYVLFTLFIIEYINHVFYQLSINRYVQEIIFNVRHEGYKKWLLSYEIITNKAHGAKKDDYPLGEVLSRLVNDSEAIRELISSGSFRIIIDLAFVISCLIGFLKINMYQGGIFLFVEVFACFGLIWGSKYMAKIFMQVRQKNGMLARTLTDVIAGMPQIYFTPHHNFASQRGLTASNNYLKKQNVANIWDACYFSLAESLFPIFLALVALSIPYTKIITIAAVAALIDMIQRSIDPIKNIAGKMSSIQRALTGIERLQEFITDLEQKKSSVTDQDYRQIELDRFEFSLKKFVYPVNVSNSFSLENINFSARAQEIIGIVGPSGSGKSTLLNAITLNILPPSMDINLFSKNGDRLSIGEKYKENFIKYRYQIGLISQESFCFSESLQFNITLDQKVNPHFDHFWNFVCDKIPYLTEWGVTPETVINLKSISAGQKQLLSALRSCYHQKPIVLFDEISSGLDSQLELALKNLLKIMQEKSLTLIVAHRLETILKSDKILLLDEGKQIAFAKHDQLIQNSDLYKKLIGEINLKNR